MDVSSLGPQYPRQTLIGRGRDLWCCATNSVRFSFPDDEEGVNTMLLPGQLESDPLRGGGREEDGDEESMLG